MTVGNTRDEFGPDEVITIDGQPTITVGQLAEYAFAQEAAYRASMEAAGLGALLPPAHDGEGD